jgi:SAM-dependent methyltransferase
MTEKGRDAFLAAVRPEIGAGGFARDDSSINFFLRVNALLEPDMTVVDLGAGRGTSLLGEEDFTKRLRRLQGKVRKVIGIDVDSAIDEHPYLDERHIVAIGDPYPLDAESVDLIVCDWVLEHVADPESFVREVERVLKPGGWFCARTPNRWGYVGIVTNLVPNTLHTGVLSRVWPERDEVDVFPTVYRLNTRAAVRRHFPASRWENFSYFINPPPKYHGNRAALFGIIGTYQKLVPLRMKTDLIVALRKAS